MPLINLSFAKDPNTLALALIYGMIPAVAWLFFWLREQRDRPKGTGTLFYAFIAGALMVIASLPVEKFLDTLSSDTSVLMVLWASAEEVLKFAAFMLMLVAGSAVEKPVDYAMYAVVVGLGFAGFENSLYFLEPLQTGNSVVLILASAMRFLGTTLMHAAAASLPGIALGLAYYRTRPVKIAAAAVGLIAAAALHSLFNVWIVKNGGVDFFSVFSFLWVATIAILILFEYLRRMGSDEYSAGKREGAITGLSRTLAAYLEKIGAPASELRPMAELLTEKGITPGSPEHAEFTALIAQLRMAYSAYLASAGASQAEVEKVVSVVIPDTISPKSAQDIMTVMLHAVTDDGTARRDIQI